jgi:hypothetical protein
VLAFENNLLGNAVSSPGAAEWRGKGPEQALGCVRDASMYKNVLFPKISKNSILKMFVEILRLMRAEISAQSSVFLDQTLSLPFPQINCANK